MTSSDWISVVSDVAQVLLILIAVVTYSSSKRKEEIDRENGTYDSLDERFTNYLKLALRNRDLPLVASEYYNIKRWEHFSAEQKYRLTCGYLILISILERAYKLYRNISSDSREKEWRGWEQYIGDYTSFPPFRKFWMEMTENLTKEAGFHRDFESFLKQKFLGDQKQC